MRLAVLFPDAESCRVGMGLELFEQYDAVWAAVRTHDRHFKTSLADALWYGGPDARELHGHERAAAVLTLSVGCYDVFRSVYGIPGHVFVGKGVGYLAALVVAGGLELVNALRIVGGERPRRSWFRRIARPVADAGGEAPARERADLRRAAAGIAPGGPLDAGALARRLTETGADTVLEIGPGDVLASAVRPALPEGVACGALDAPGNAHIALDNLNLRKFFNPGFLAERVLGQIAATRNRRGTPESQAAVGDLARRVKRLVDEGRASAHPVRAVSGADAGVVRVLARCWIDNGLIKGHTPEEVDASLRRLEDACLLPVRRIAGVDAASRVRHSAIGDLRRAA